jgi:L-ribulose-5-phosphate 4-epimerase
MIDEGYIKFRLEWKHAPPPEAEGLSDLIRVRNELFRQGLIGEYADLGIGFGNVSLRPDESERFIISGTATGGIPTAGPEHFTWVEKAIVPENRVICRGPIRASSESMTHAMIYACSEPVRAVVHVHHRGMWDWLPGKVPVSSPDVPYGTPDMAGEVARLFAEEDLAGKGIFVMGGHEEGIVSFAPDLDQAAEIVLEYFREWKAL